MRAANHAAMYRGIVVNNQDPEGRNRCQLQIPQIMGGARSGWAMPIPAVGAEVPPVGTQVMVTFEGADLTRPAYFAPSSSAVAQEALAEARQAEADAQLGISKADGAQTTANSALGLAQTAGDSAATAQSTANTAVSKADAAQTSANTAQARADKGVSDAAAAQITASTGVVTLDRLRQSTVARDTGMLTQLGADLPGYLPPDQIRSMDGGNLFPDPDLIYGTSWASANGVSGTTYWREGQGRRPGTGAVVNTDWAGMASGQAGQYLQASRRTAIPVVPGTSYLLSGWVKASAAAPANTASIYARAWDTMTDGGSYSFSSPSSIRNTKALVAGTWTRVSGVVTVPEGRYWLTPGVYREAPASGIDFTWTDISVQQVTDANLLVGGAGSGVDADKLDGQEASAFLTKSGFNTLPFTMAAGTTTVTTTSTAPYQNVQVTYPGGRFSQPPILLVTAEGIATNIVAKAHPTNSASSGFLTLVNPTGGNLPATTVTVRWIAVQMTSSSAAG